MVGLYVAIGRGVEAEEIAPMLQVAKQVAPNKLQITYDKAADNAKATDISNYWIQNLDSNEAVGVASLGKDQKINAGNALSEKKAKVVALNGSEMEFEITFREPITPGVNYKLIICYVSAPGAKQYDGDNGTVAFTGQK